MYDTNARPWIGSALCAQVGGDGFFPEMRARGDAPIENILSVSQAKSICGRCEVQAECLEYAISTDERYGVWGGLSAVERRRMREGKAIDPRSADHGLIREWARDQGIEVKDVGVLPKKVVEAYRAAHPTTRRAS